MKNYFSYEFAVIGEGTKRGHFFHTMSDSIIGNNCNIGQNLVLSLQVTLGGNVKI